MNYRIGAMAAALTFWGMCAMAGPSIPAARPRNHGPRTAPAFRNSARAQTPSSNATVFSPSEMSAALAQGKNLLNKNGMSYFITAGHRDSPGEVEVHTHYTDLIYIIDGAATFVTGGRTTQGKTIAPGEIRGKSIEAGVTHRIEKGSLAIVPAGVPHWFKAVSSPIVDLVIKVRTD